MLIQICIDKIYVGFNSHLPTSLRIENQIAYPINTMQNEFTFRFRKHKFIKHIFSSAYHLSSNGRAERLLQTVKKRLSSLTIEWQTPKKNYNNYL